MKKLTSLFLVLFSTYSLLAQKQSGDALNTEDSLALKKLLTIDFNEFVCKKAKYIFGNSQLNHYNRIELTNSGRLGNYNGLLLYYSDRVYLRIEVRDNVPFDNPEKSKKWYIEKVKRKKVVTIQIPPHLLYKE